MREGRPHHGGPGSHHDHAATQTQRRFDLVHLDPFSYDTPDTIAAWVAHLAGVAAQLRLLRAKPGMLTDAGMPEYLFRRTGGIVGLLERLVEDGCTQAIDTGQEHLSIDLLDGIDIDLGNTASRDTTAGEIPSIDRRVPAGATRRARNTVFDDTPAPTTAPPPTSPPISGPISS